MCASVVLAIKDFRKRHSSRSGIARHFRDETAPHNGAIRAAKSTGSFALAILSPTWGVAGWVAVAKPWSRLRSTYADHI